MHYNRYYCWQQYNKVVQLFTAFTWKGYTSTYLYLPKCKGFWGVLLDLESQLDNLCFSSYTYKL